MRRAPRWSLGAMPEDTFGRVTGSVLDGELLVAPLSGRSCVYFSVFVDERLRPKLGANAPHWTRLAAERRGVPFVIEEDGHRAVIEPRRARVMVDIDYGRYRDPPDPPP